MTDTRKYHITQRDAIVNVVKVASDDINFVYEIGAEFVYQLCHVFFAQGWQSFCVQQITHSQEKGFWVPRLVIDSVGVELGPGSIEHLLNNISWVHEYFPVDDQPGQPLHPSSHLPRRC